MMRLTSLILILISSTALGQSVSRQVIAATGSLGTGSISSSTTGPSILTTTNPDESIHLTQGFQQPTAEVLQVEFVISSPSCINYSGGSIEVIIQGCSGSYNIEWNTGSNEELIEDLLPGTYSIQILSGTCFYSNEITLALEEDCDEEIPNLLTINGDGINDSWIVPLLHLEANSDNLVRIFNRWGQVVWENNSYDNNTVVWKGENNSDDELPTGTYFYEISVRNGQNFTGYVELLR